jgi:hypothetical protein
VQATYLGGVSLPLTKLCCCALLIRNTIVGVRVFVRMYYYEAFGLERETSNTSAIANCLNWLGKSTDIMEADSVDLYAYTSAIIHKR